VGPPLGGIVRRPQSKLARMAVVQDRARLEAAGAEACGADENQHRNAGLDAELVIGIVGRIARVRRQRSRNRAGVTTPMRLSIRRPTSTRRELHEQQTLGRYPAGTPSTNAQPLSLIGWSD